jgi:hypothetical protein
LVQNLISGRRHGHVGFGYYVAIQGLLNIKFEKNERKISEQNRNKFKQI